MDIVARAAVVFLFLWVVTRALGKRELGQMTAFELVLLVTMGDLIQQGTTQEDFSVTGAMLAVGTFASLMLLFSWLSFRFRRTRPLLEGVPVVVIRDGQPLEELMRTERISDWELDAALREQGVRDVRDVRVGVLEPDGRFSFFTQDSGGSDPSSADEPATT